MPFGPNRTDPVPSIASSLSSLPMDMARRIATGLDVAEAAACLFTPDDSIAYVSPAFAVLFDLQPTARTFSDMMRHCHSAGTGAIIATGDIDAWLLKALEKRRSVPQRTFEIDMHDGRWFWAREATFDGGWLLLAVSDITALKINERILRQAHDAALYWAETDALTKLYNRHFAMTNLEQAVLGAHASGNALSVALLDLDHFKTINDSHGHDIGDQVLQHFARTARGRIRKSDVLARVGGEEFLLIMPNADACQTFHAMDRLRDRVAQAWPLGTDILRYTFSTGVVQLRLGETPHELYRRADQALYRAKRSGRNRVEMETNPDGAGTTERRSDSRRP